MDVLIVLDAQVAPRRHEKTHQAQALQIHPPLPCPRVHEPASPSPSTTALGILSADIVKGKGGVEAVIVRLAPHNLIVITGGNQPTVSMACTHHGFVAEAFELKGQLEQGINHVRKLFPKLRTD